MNEWQMNDALLAKHGYMLGNYQDQDQDVDPAEPDAYAIDDPHDMPRVPAWPHVGGNGRILNTEPNLSCLLDHYGFTVRYDVIRKDLVVTYPGQSGTQDNQKNAAFSTIESLCNLNRMPTGSLAGYLLKIGDRNQYNPVMDWITVKPWDGQSRLSALADTLVTTPGYDRDLLRLLLRKWLISAVAAAAKPSGFNSRGVLTLQGPQSIGKTRWFARLVPEDQRDLLKVDALINPAEKDTVISAVSHWLVEIGELDGTFRKADIAKLKGFITADYDSFRRPYAKAEEKYPRRTVFFASVNDDAFLVDDTGNTRWWTVPVVRINHAHEIDMQQLWAEVFEIFQSGEQWWLTREEEARLEESNDNHRQVDPIEEKILSSYDFSEMRTQRMTATEVLEQIGIQPTAPTKRKASKILRDHAGEPVRTGKGRFFDMPRKIPGS
ncbi:MAG: VapE domain-containing protein [Porticoccaceae bacterium]